jgi:hypothetical protein
MGVGSFFFIGCVITNIHSLVVIIKKKHSSMIPFIGGISGMIVCLISPWTNIRPYWWVSFILDVSYGLTLFGLIKMIYKRICYNKIN